MHALVTSTPGAGHVFPLVPVVRGLRDAGHTVVWATGTEAHPWLDRIGIEHVPAGIDTSTRHRSAMELVPHLQEVPPHDRRALIGPATFGRVAAPPMLADLRGVVARTSPDLVITEPCELAAPLIAHVHDLPHVTVGFGGLLPDAVVEGMAAAVAPLWHAAGRDAPADAGLYGARYLHPFPPSFGALPEHLPVSAMRGGGFDGAATDPPPWVAELGTARHLVYVTFRTEHQPAAPLVAMMSALAALDADAVITVGSRADPATLPTSPNNVRIERFVPQRALLGRASLVVSHAGSGTVLGAAAHGVPQVCIPLAADQFDNALAVEAAGAGDHVPAAGATTDVLHAAMARLLADPPAGAARVAAEIAAMPAPTELVGVIEALAAT